VFRELAEGMAQVFRGFPAARIKGFRDRERLKNSGFKTFLTAGGEKGKEFPILKRLTPAGA
jgi:hypothetical protein